MSDLQVSTNDGKYTVVDNGVGGVDILRHGEPCPNVIRALAYDLAEMREELDAERKKLKAQFTKRSAL